jgi:hypothetical protein
VKPATSLERGDSSVYNAFAPNPEILAGRAGDENALRDHAMDARRRVAILNQRLVRGEINNLEHTILMANLKRQVVEQSQIIVHGEHALYREKFVEKYGCVRCTESAISTCKEYSPLIEIGAGAGQWQRALTEAGADIVAFDSGADLPMPGQQPYGVVQYGNETELSLNQHRGRTLLLVYPPPGSLAKSCLDAYRGEVVLYVGEGRQGCNGDSNFFDTVEANYSIETILPLEPFPGGYEKLYVLKRNNSWPCVLRGLWPWAGIALKLLLAFNSSAERLLP